MHFLAATLSLLGVPTLGACSNSIQQPLSPESAFNASTYTIQRVTGHDGEDISAATDGPIRAQVGRRAGIIFGVRVFEEGNPIPVCVQALYAVSPPEAAPDDIFFADSDYAVRVGTLAPNVYPPQNPWRYIPWYGGFATVSMTGYACPQYIQNPVTVTAQVIINSAIVTFENYDCPPESIIGKDGIYPSLDLKSKKLPKGCEIHYQISNGLGWDANFALVQTITVEEVYIIANQQTIALNQGSLPVLDADGKPPKFVISSWTESVANGKTETLSTIDPPGITIGNGCYTYPTNRTNTLDFDSVGFKYTFKDFVLQDYDQINSLYLAQTPVGGDAVVTWGVNAQANRGPNGTWVTDAGNRVLNPQLLPPVSNLDVEWNDFAQNTSRLLYSFNEDTGCFDLS